MANLFGRLSPGEFSELSQALKETGASLATWYEAVRYAGEPKPLQYELVINRRLLSKTRLAAGDDAKGLESIAYFLGHHADWKSARFSVRRCHANLQTGGFVLVERRAFRGVEAERVSEVVKRFGGGPDDIDYILNRSEDSVLGYLLTTTEERARSFAEAVHQGATGPARTEDVARVVSNLRAHVDNLPADQDATIEEVMQRLTTMGVPKDTLRKLLDEYGTSPVEFESPIDRMTRGDVRVLFAQIDASPQLTLDQKAVAYFALLAALDGSVPSTEGLACLKTVSGPELTDAILQKRSQLADESGFRDQHLPPQGR